jgi:uncharacterized protein (DUF2384 family)
MIPARAAASLDSAPPRDAASKDAVAVKAMARVFKFWRVSGDEAARLVGVSPRTWSRMKKDEWAGSLSKDQRLRASAIVGLYKGLHLYFGDNLADKWVKMVNTGPLFRGVAPLDFMLAGTVMDIIATRQYVDAIRGGM